MLQLQIGTESAVAASAVLVQTAEKFTQSLFLYPDGELNLLSAGRQLLRSHLNE